MPIRQTARVPATTAARAVPALGWVCAGHPGCESGVEERADGLHVASLVAVHGAYEIKVNELCTYVNNVFTIYL